MGRVRNQLSSEDVVWVSRRVVFWDAMSRCIFPTRLIPHNSCFPGEWVCNHNPFCLIRIWSIGHHFLFSLPPQKLLFFFAFIWQSVKEIFLPRINYLPESLFERSRGAKTGNRARCRFRFVCGPVTVRASTPQSIFSGLWMPFPAVILESNYMTLVHRRRARKLLSTPHFFNAPKSWPRLGFWNDSLRKFFFFSNPFEL